MAGIELKLQLKIAQTLVLTPQLQLAIKLLQLPRLELIETIRQELEENPVLDDVQGTQEDEDVTVSHEGASPSYDGNDGEGEGGTISETEVKGGKEVDWERYLENASLSPVIPTYRRGSDDEMPGVEAAPSKEKNLFEHLIWQVRLSEFTPSEERMAVLIIGNLDESGYFREEFPPEPKEPPEAETAQADAPSGCEEAPQAAEPVSEGEDTAVGEDKAEGAGAASEAAAGIEPDSAVDEALISEPEDAWQPAGMYMNLDVLAMEADMTFEDAENLLKRIQRLDPVGVAARNLEECLIIQAEVLGFDETVKDIIRNHLKNLQKRNFNTIAKDLKISTEQVVAAARKILSLDPKPARNFTGDPPHYIVPDVYVEKVGDEYIVKINDDGMPKLRISDSYRKHIKDPQAKDYIKGKLRNAHWLIRSIEQRRKTIIRVTECIVEKQQLFMEKGPVHLKPMVLHDVARTLDLHESTISRVTSGKYVHTPQGIFELKYFFNTGIQTTNHEDTSSEAVKSKIIDIIEKEEKSAPYSDQEIVKMLGSEGIVIARRTVAKYRDMLNILPSNQRKHIL